MKLVLLTLILILLIIVIIGNLKCNSLMENMVDKSSCVSSLSGVDGFPLDSETIGYHPERWNCQKDNTECQRQKSHNCYTYVLDDLHSDVIEECEDRIQKGQECNNMFHQPGHYYQKKYLGRKGDNIKRNGNDKMNCPKLMQQLKRDNHGVILFEKNLGGQDKCPPGYYMGALTIDPGKMYHFYRRDQWDKCNNKYYWSHKDGGAKATNLDSAGNRITDPATANRKYNKYNYSEVCPYFCVPGNNAVGIANPDTLSDHRLDM